jgi:hypothetical protein
MGRSRFKDCGSRPVGANSSTDFRFQNNQSKMDWRCDSSITAPALQPQSPEFQTLIPLKEVKNCLKKVVKEAQSSQVWCHMPVIPHSAGRLRVQGRPRLHSEPQSLIIDNNNN